MRPVVRGAVPLHNGRPLVFTDYKQARDPLIERLGDYCSYCEMPCAEGPDVEHVRPKGGKAGNPALELVWDNFLLGCIYCNTVKGDTPVRLNQYFWPDRDNTFRLFRYDRDRAPQVKPGLAGPARSRARKTLLLTGLDREPGHPDLTPRDTRWVKRREAWGKALRALDRLTRCPTAPMRAQILDTATSTGFFSVWMTVFAGHPDMRAQFIRGFRGTSGIGECFDVNTRPIPRAGGAF
jgi:hypothetical protein